MRSRSSWRRVRVERGIYLLPNGKYAVLCRRTGSSGIGPLDPIWRWRGAPARG